MPVVVELLACLCLALAGPPSTTAQGPEAPVSSDEAAAKQLFGEARYHEAAARYEALWAATTIPKYLFNAAMARELAGHEAHAYLHLLRYLALDSLQPAEIEKARARLEALKQRAVPLQLVVTPPADALSGTLELESTGAPTDVGRTPLALDAETLRRTSVPGAPGTFDLYVEPGTWTLSLSARGYVSEQRKISMAEGERRQLALNLAPEKTAVTPITVRFAPASAAAAGIEVVAESSSRSLRFTVPPSGRLELELPDGDWTLRASADGFAARSAALKVAGQPQSLALELEPSGRGHDQDARGKLARGLKIGGAVTLTVGAGLAIVGGIATQPSYASFTSCNGMAGCYERGVHREQWRALWLYDTGALLFGVGTTAAIYGAVLNRGNARTTWRARLGIGAALASLGLISGVASYAAPNGLSDVLWDRFPDIDKHQFRGILAGNILAFALAGSGIALMTLAPVEHKVTSRGGLRERSTITPRVTLAGAGVDLKVRF